MMMFKELIVDRTWEARCRISADDRRNTQWPEIFAQVEQVIVERVVFVVIHET